MLLLEQDEAVEGNEADVVVTVVDEKGYEGSGSGLQRSGGGGELTR